MIADDRPVLVIPAYRPGPELLRVLDSIDARRFHAVVVVDDGSGPEYRAIFEAVRGRVFTHSRNLGKGEALRTAIRHVLAEYPGRGIVTADADGQHHPDDISRIAARLAETRDVLILGARNFEEKDVPARSRIGNRLARTIFLGLIGQRLRDTQTGLRGIPAVLLIDLAAIDAPGYEFEVEMLALAKHLSLAIIEEPVRTIYEPGNPTSHFHPFRDSLRIGFVLGRFTLLSLATAALDNLVFSLALHASFSVTMSQVFARGVAVCLNYPIARRAVFRSLQPRSGMLVRYLMLVTASGILSFVILRLLSRWVDVLTAKRIAESALFILNFVIQRDWVFVQRRAGEATDWDLYYRSPAPSAHLTRRYTGGVVVGVLRRFAGRVDRLVEIGGANSCFLEKIQAELEPGEYHVIDTNAHGLSLLGGRRVVAHRGDCLDLKLDLAADAVFSVGLIEHFDRKGTATAIASHFALIRPGGCAIISYPTPTWLYRSARWIAESAGLWRFPDERPLHPDEVEQAARPFGRLEFAQTLWPIVFTQKLMVFRKHA